MVESVELCIGESGPRKPHVIFTLLEELGLDKPQYLGERIREAPLELWRHMFERLEEWYAGSGALRPIVSSAATPLSFSYPSLPARLLPSISRHMLMADISWLDDPLFDSLFALVLGWSLLEKLADDVDTNSGYTWFRGLTDRLLVEVEGYIRFYLMARESVLEGLLVPYKDMDTWDTPVWPAEFVNETLVALASDSRFLKAFGISMKRHWRKLFRPREINHLVRLLRRKGVVDGVTGDVILEPLSWRGRLAMWLTPQDILVHAMTQMLPVMSSFLQLATYGMPGQSTDFITPEMAYVFRRCLTMIEEANSRRPPAKQIPAPMQFSDRRLQVLLLRDMPVERVLDVASIEPQAFNSYRAWLNEQLLQISAPPGSAEREREIARIQENIDNDLAGISLAYQNVREKFARRFAIDLPLAVIGIAVAGIGVSGRNLDALAIAASVAGGTGAATGMKDLVDHWLGYLGDLDDLRLRDNYFVWKLMSRD